LQGTRFLLLARFDVLLKSLRLLIASLLTFFAYYLTACGPVHPVNHLQLITDYPLVFVVLGGGWNELLEKGRRCSAEAHVADDLHSLVIV
jgi:hypothetical protein